MIRLFQNFNWSSDSFMGKSIVCLRKLDTGRVGKYWYNVGYTEYFPTITINVTYY